MNKASKGTLTFNTALETGIRSVAILAAAHPLSFDLQRLVGFDHIIVHTGDMNGPKSLHPPAPLRTAELLVRRSLVERGLLLMASRTLVQRHARPEGILYCAGEISETFLSSLTSPYIDALRVRADWVAKNFADMDDDAFREAIRNYFDRWVEEFQAVHQSLAGEA